MQQTQSDSHSSRGPQAPSAVARSSNSKTMKERQNKQNETQRRGLPATFFSMHHLQLYIIPAAINCRCSRRHTEPPSLESQQCASPSVPLAALVCGRSASPRLSRRVRLFIYIYYTLQLRRRRLSLLISFDEEELLEQSIGFLSLLFGVILLFQSRW